MHVNHSSSRIWLILQLVKLDGSTLDGKQICKEKFLTLPIIKDSPFVVYVTAGMIAEAVWYDFNLTLPSIKLLRHENDNGSRSCIKI